MRISKVDTYQVLENDTYRKYYNSVSVMDMQLIEIPEIIVLRDQEAIEALHEFIGELEGQRGKDLTDKQTDALVSFAEGLISSIEAEMRSKAPNEETRLMEQLKKTTMKCISRPARMFDAYTRFARMMFQEFPAIIRRNLEEDAP